MQPLLYFSEYTNPEYKKPPSCGICNKDSAEIEITRPGVPIPDYVCMKCYAHPDYQEIVLKNNLKRKLI